MQSIIDNLINGNLRDAKRLAKRHSLGVLLSHMIQQLGWSADRSLAAAYYLKGMSSFQDYCNVTDKQEVAK
jgi:hypothetical protein